MRALFETVGAVVEVPEEQINALSTISGSGPAYVFFLIERLTETARNLGFDEQQARLMVEQTFLGASRAARGIRRRPGGAAPTGDLSEGDDRARDRRDRTRPT